VTEMHSGQHVEVAVVSRDDRAPRDGPAPSIYCGAL
jgi:hypothetical protein